jgi:hypothetical protein
MLNPLLNVTVPVGVAPVALTVAVKVTVCWKVEGLGADTSEVVVATLFTIWLKTAEVLAASLASPL